LRPWIYVALALLVVAFAATWATLPTRNDQRVSPPASFFLFSDSGKHLVGVCVEWEGDNSLQHCARTIQQRVGTGYRVDAELVRRRA
jgi:hypothetical protein